MTEREALKLALEALELHGKQYPHMVKGYCLDAITAIKEALAQPEQEPVAFIDMHEWPPIRWRDGMVRSDVATFDGQGLFFAPPHRKPLTDEMTKQMRESCDSYEMRGAFVDGWLSAEAAHDIKE